MQYLNRNEAESAMESMNGLPVGRSRVRISWGRSVVKHPNIPVQQAGTCLSVNARRECVGERERQRALRAEGSGMRRENQPERGLIRGMCVLVLRCEQHRWHNRSSRLR